MELKVFLSIVGFIIIALMGFFIAFRSYQLESRLKKNNVRGSSPIDLLKALGVEIIEENKERFIVAFQ